MQCIQLFLPEMGWERAQQQVGPGVKGSNLPGTHAFHMPSSSHVLLRLSTRDLEGLWY